MPDDPLGVRTAPPCGAGISIPSNMPCWHEQYRNFLESVLGGIAKPNSLHHKIVNLPVPAILTTNYDRLLENAYATEKGYIPKTYTADDTPIIWRAIAREEYFLLKVNGDITHSKTVVLTSGDYTRHVFGNPNFMALVQRIILSYSILFIGSSLSDIYLRRILEESTFMTGQTGMPRFALLSDPGPLRTKLLREQFNVFVMPYSTEGGHDQGVADFPDALHAATVKHSW